MLLKSYLNKYLMKLSSIEREISFSSVTGRYGKFTLYCILGPKENIVHLTFAADKHRKALQQLSSISPLISIRALQMKDFPYHSVFQDYFCGKLSDFPITVESPFLEAGTDFQKKIWRGIKTIPYGTCITYQRLAELAGSPKGSRAAGMACGANPVSLIIPCHRVVAVNGLGGFAGGLAAKKALLALEHAGSNSVNSSGQSSC
jgi:methylated-DNA-[protein]-cysteine S-methyltransferase